MNRKELWNHCYEVACTPWDIGKPNPDLKKLVKMYLKPHSTILEVGCGTGANALWLAKQGHKVTAIDYAKAAIELAQLTIKEMSIKPKFKVADIQSFKSRDKFEAIIDCAVFNVMESLTTRKRYVKAITKHLKNNGLWISIIINRDQMIERSKKLDGYHPPGLSALEIVESVEPHFEIIRLEQTEFKLRLEHNLVTFLAFMAVFRKRK